MVFQVQQYNASETFENVPVLSHDTRDLTRGLSEVVETNTTFLVSYIEVDLLVNVLHEEMCVSTRSVQLLVRLTIYFSGTV